MSTSDTRLTPKKSFTQRLEALLERDGITKVELGTALKRDNSTVGKWAKGTREPGLNDLAAIARHFKVSIDWLLGLVDPGFDHASMRARLDLKQEKATIAAALRGHAERLQGRSR